MNVTNVVKNSPPKEVLLGTIARQAADVYIKSRYFMNTVYNTYLFKINACDFPT